MFVGRRALGGVYIVRSATFKLNYVILSKVGCIQT